ncbi:MAG: hypothetical protein KAR13_10405, partial [Desulfobulbaceae bacterium]|nr:hypothetical protein [Desulfobulbaceae bacterium]
MLVSLIAFLWSAAEYLRKKSPAVRIGKNRIAITGLGIISCLGLDRNTVQQSLQDQRCGIKLLESR